eukprot:355050-Karenia_brevis.AAC.1
MNLHINWIATHEYYRPCGPPWPLRGWADIALFPRTVPSPLGPGGGAAEVPSPLGPGGGAAEVVAILHQCLQQEYR